jgi:rRNA maturation endonuclease Nob1
MDNKESQSYVYCFKCKACSLEFSVYSWKEDWLDKNKAFCPECGEQKAISLAKKVSKRLISELVYDKNI